MAKWKWRGYAKISSDGQKLVITVSDIKILIYLEDLQKLLRREIPFTKILYRRFIKRKAPQKTR